MRVGTKPDGGETVALSIQDCFPHSQRFRHEGDETRVRARDPLLCISRDRSLKHQPAPALRLLAAQAASVLHQITSVSREGGVSVGWVIRAGGEW